MSGDDSDILWEGERTTLTSKASKGKLVRARYRITADFLYFDAGLISTTAEQIPTWSIRDIDMKQSMKQKALGVGDVHVHCQHDDYTGRANMVLEAVKEPREVRDLVNRLAATARDIYLRKQQQSFTEFSGNVAPPMAPAPAMTSAPAVAADDPIAKLKELKELLDAGVLTEEEFAAEKAKVLG